MFPDLKPQERTAPLTRIWAEQALTASGWADAVAIDIGEDGKIASLAEGAAPDGLRVGVLLPAPANIHSHAFQRAMAGMTEARGPDPKDSFWTWRKLMYGFLAHLGPDDVEAIAALVLMEMLEAGYACVAEFHYLHHQPGGAPYDNVAELSTRIAAAANETGIGLTLLPVLYEQGGCDGRPLEGGQLRFGNTPDRFAKLREAASAALAGLPRDAVIGAAAHSLRAVSPESLTRCAELAKDSPFHIHIAEQTAEVDEVAAARGKRPVEWLLENHDVNERWCMIHATQMKPHETEALAKSGAVAGLCPITEANLGDGIFDGARYLEHGGRFGIGSDSNIRIALAEELRLLEYSQRLRDVARAVLATRTASTGRVLFEGAARGSAQAAGRNSGALETGRLADLVALDSTAIDLAGKKGDSLLDSYIFAVGDRLVTDVWSAGRHMVQGGRHIKRDAILAHYHKQVAKLKSKF